MGGGSSCYYAASRANFPLLAGSSTPSSMKKEMMSTVGTMSTNESLQDEWIPDHQEKRGNMLALDEVLNMPLTTKDMLEHEEMMSRSEELLGWEVRLNFFYLVIEFILS
ncbi:hypothetical protein EON65_04315 [archaeon]|nr:MAG: hypothetical protein EON65_04315 [archaeon]